MRKVQSDFPILNKKSRKLVYLDSAATSLKPKQVIKSVTDFYENYSANVHRGIYQESEEATENYEGVRDKVAKLINSDSSEVIFTKNATEAINLVAKTWESVKRKGERGKKILTTVMEHHSNLIPWQKLLGSKLVFLDINNNGELDLSDLENQLKGVSLVAVAHVSNVLGTINPVEKIIKAAHEDGALVLIDGAQAAGHMRVDIKKLGCDFYVFSGHKMLGPSGVGVLWMRKEIAESLPPFLTGGGMVGQDTPYKFEAGTPNIEGVIGLGAAIDYLRNVGMDKIREHEKTLTEYALKKFSRVRGLTVYGPLDINKRGGVIAFNIEGIHPHDLASLLDNDGIAIRAGHHCAMPLHERLGIKASARISFYIYNSIRDIDRLVVSLQKIKRLLKV